MFFSFSFPLEESANISEIQTRIKRINRFFLRKADLTSNTRAFGIQLLAPFNRELPPNAKDYYLLFKFFNPSRQRQKKLELFYSIGNDEELIKSLELDVYCLSRISSFSLEKVSFSCDTHNLNIAIEFDDAYFSDLQSYLKMLFNDFRAREASQNT